MNLDRVQEISQNYVLVQENINKAAKDAGRKIDDIKLIVVTKTYPVSDLEILYSLGIRDFGENRDQEATSKVNQLPNEISWHFQGVLQSNKLKSIVNWAKFIHSISEIKHLEILQKLLFENDNFENDNKVQQDLRQDLKIFLQINLDPIEHRAGRGGIYPEDLPAFFEKISRINFGQKLSDLIMGVMGVAPNPNTPITIHGLANSNNSLAKEAFEELARISKEYANQGLIGPSISAGMSNDYQDAIAAGATHIRIGSSILGPRS